MNKSKRISLGAMVTLLSIVLMFMTSIIPTTKIFLVSLASFLTATLVVEASVSTAIISFIATSVLGFILVPNKILVVSYALFFGYYGIVKFYIESINSLVLEWIVKMLIFNIILALGYFLLTRFFIDQLKLPFHIGLIVLGLQVVFIIYDYIFSMFIQYYKTDISRHIR